MDLMMANMQWVNWIFPKTLRIQTANLPGKPMEYENWMFGDKDGVSRDHALDFAKEQVRNRKRNLKIQADKDRTWICRHTKDLGYCFHAFSLHQADKDFHWNFQYDYDYDYEWNYVYNDGGWTYGNGDCVLVPVCLYLFIITIAYFILLHWFLSPVDHLYTVIHECILSIFIGSESDHWQPLSLTDSITD